MNQDESLLALETQRFCREDVLAPWEQVLRCLRGEATTGWLRPMLGLGPPLPLGLVRLLMPPSLVRTFLGRDANLLTIVLDRQRVRVVYMAVERALHGHYLAMERLDKRLSNQDLDAIAHCVAAGNERKALRLVQAHLGRLGLGEFRPAVLKVADLHFFDAFAQLCVVQRQGTRAQWLAQAAAVAQQVLAERLLYFYPAVPAERLLRAGRWLATAHAAAL